MSWEFIFHSSHKKQCISGLVLDLTEWFTEAISLFVIRLFPMVWPIGKLNTEVCVMVRVRERSDLICMA